MSEPNIYLGKLLFEMRTEQGLSLREFSERLNISHAYLNKLEKGIDPRTGKEVTPTIETMSKISAGLGIKLTDLIEGSGYSEPAGELQAAGESRPLAIENLADEFIDAIFNSQVISLDGKVLSEPREEIIELAIEEIYRRVKIIKPHPHCSNNF